jgi:hypothetical protein
VTALLVIGGAGFIALVGFAVGYLVAPQPGPDGWKVVLARKGYAPCRCGTWVGPEEWHVCRPSEVRK